MAQAPRRRVIGWKLDRGQRAELLKMFPPIYGEVVADHVTLRSGVGPGEPLPSEAAAEIVGHADDGQGVQCLAVRLNGTTGRPDGGTYHITWSLAPGRRARESNDVLRERGFTPVEPTPVTLTPADI